MKKWIETINFNLRRRLIVPVVAALAVASLGAYEFAKPSSSAMAAAPTPAAAALDDNSVEPLLALDRAMENVAARVTPAIVNVTVASKTGGRSDNGDMNDDDQGNDNDGSNDPRQFGPFQF